MCSNYRSSSFFNNRSHSELDLLSLVKIPHPRHIRTGESPLGKEHCGGTPASFQSSYCSLVSLWEALKDISNALVFPCYQSTPCTSTMYPSRTHSNLTIHLAQSSVALQRLQVLLCQGIITFSRTPANLTSHSPLSCR
jgi:hypothetical protein